jgi:hypothetical protein
MQVVNSLLCVVDVLLLPADTIAAAPVVTPGTQRNPIRCLRLQSHCIWISGTYGVWNKSSATDVWKGGPWQLSGINAGLLSLNHHDVAQAQ